MKKLLMGLGLAVLMAGCASQDENGKGGTSDQEYQSMKTDSDSSQKSIDQFHNNASNGTGSSTATNSSTTQP